MRVNRDDEQGTIFATKDDAAHRSRSTSVDGDGLARPEQVYFPTPEPIMLTAESAPEVKLNLRNISTGEVIERLLVDAK